MLWIWLLGWPIVLIAILCGFSRSSIRLSRGELIGAFVVAGLWPLWIVAILLLFILALYGCYKAADIIAQAIKF